MLRLAIRRLSTSPAFAAFSIVTLAVGIGVTTAIYSTFLSMDRKTVDIRDSDEVRTVGLVGLRGARFSAAEFAELRTNQTGFDALAAVNTFRSGLATEQRAELVGGEAVSGDYFPMLGVRPALGRLLQPSDDQPDAAPVLVLTDATWRRQFDRASNVIGRSVRLGGRPYEVVGVAPRGFNGVSAFSNSSPGVWTPLATAPFSRRGLTSRSPRELMVIGRLAAGVSPEAAASRLQPLIRQMELVAARDQAHARVPFVMVDSTFDPEDRRGRSGELTLIVVLPALVLLVACTNLANLVLSRNASRRHEFAVRRALGASRWRAISDQLVEGAVVSIAGGLAGCLVAAYLLALIGGVSEGFRGVPGLPGFDFIPIMDTRVFLAAAGSALLAFLIASVSPALQLTRSSERATLSIDTGAGVAPRWRGRANLIALQVWVSVCLFLLTAMGVQMILDEHRSRTVASSDDRLAQVNLSFDEQSRDEPTARRITDRIVTELNSHPHVDAVALTVHSLGSSMTITTPDRPLPADQYGGIRERMDLMSPAAFRLMGVSMRFGRSFNAQDDATGQPVLIVNESLARVVFGRVDVVGQTVLGRSVDFTRRTWVTKAYQIIGVSADAVARSGRVEHVVYAPFTQHYTGELTILVRGRQLDVDETLTIVRTAVHNADPDLALSFAGRANPERWIQAALARLMTMMAGGLAALALVLAMTGLYGVLSHVVARRTREIGLRMALGADRNRIMALVMRDGFRPVIEGLVLGCLSALVLRAMLQPFLTNFVAAFDPLLVGLAAGPLFVAAGLACYFPAWRAARVEPNVALRDQ